MSATFESIDAVYEGGVFKPLNPTRLKEGDQVRLLLGRSDGPNRSIRLPDPPIEDESLVAPFDLPRGPGRRVHPKRGAERLPDGVGL